MPVMKAQQVRGVRESAIVMDLSDLETEGSRIIARARAEASRIVMEARAGAEREALRIREEAREAGHREGYEAGLAEGSAKAHQEVLAQESQAARELAGRWAEALTAFERNMPVYLADAKTDLVKLALAIATRVTHAEALRNRQVAPAVVEEALRLVGAARVVALRVNPGEADLLETFLPELLARLRSIESVQLIPDEAIGPGGCEARFGAGGIDARLETQLQRIADELLASEGS